MQVARPGPASGTEAPSAGRHRGPDTSASDGRTADRPARHGRDRPSPRSVARVEAAREAASRPVRPEVPAPRPAPVARRADPSVAEEAVTDLVSRAGLANGPGTGGTPGLLGLVLSGVALVGAGLAAAVPAAVLPLVGRLGDSRLALLVVLGLALLGTGCAALGVGREREGRRVAVVGVVVGLAALLACALPLLG
ncbi:hypothetical protein [Actinomycetospora atypica]|uniref:Uncharacterized protein n=1 Tax=Actinomycetospora atypica TaxID=1290095 RepID=A0ABV9YTC4_9PSEU